MDKNNFLLICDRLIRWKNYPIGMSPMMNFRWSGKTRTRWMNLIVTEPNNWENSTVKALYSSWLFLKEQNRIGLLKTVRVLE